MCLYTPRKRFNFHINFLCNFMEVSYLVACCTNGGKSWGVKSRIFVQNIVDIIFAPVSLVVSTYTKSVVNSEKISAF